jgi:hypothetical protein
VKQIQALIRAKTFQPPLMSTTTAEKKKTRAPSGKVGRQSWATAEQETWLKERLPKYIEAQSAKLSEFWPEIWEGWFGLWPEPTISNNSATSDVMPVPNTENPAVKDMMKVSHIILQNIATYNSCHLAYQAMV